MYFIFMLYLATVFASSHEKYIDLLPEEEKQEFLDRAMRRIMDNVKAKMNATTSSEHISDEQLKKHDEFVRSIIKEESKHIEMVKDEKVDDNIAKNIDVKPLRTIHREDDTNSDNLDLIPVDMTVNEDEGRRSELYKEKFVEEMTRDVSNNISSIQKRSVQNNVTDNDSEHKQSAKGPDLHESDIDEVKETTMDTLTTEINDMKIIQIAPTKVNDNVLQEIKHKNITNVETNTELDVEISKEIGPVTETYIDVTINKVTTSEPAVDDIEVKSLKKKTKEKKIIHIKTVAENSNTNLKKNMNTQDVLQLNTTINDGKNEHEKDSQTIENSTLSSNLTAEGTTETIKTTTAYENMQNSHTIMPNELTNINKKQNNSITGINSKAKPKILTKTIFPKPNVNKKKSIKIPEIIIQSHSKLSDLVTEALKVAKDRYKKKYSKAQEYKNFLNSQIKPKAEQNKFAIKHYRVYEVDVPTSNKTLLRNDNSMVEQPHYVPVYEYSPNKAHFNPDNRYGPNVDEDQSNDDIILRKGEESSNGDDEGSKGDENDDSDEKDSESKISEGHVKKFALYHAHTTRVPNNIVSTTVKRKEQKKQKTEHPKNTDTSDELHFPDSYEQLDPYNNMKGGMKSHIKAIREILHNNGIFDEFHHEYKDIHKDYSDDIESKNELLRANKFQLDFGGYKIIVINNGDRSNGNGMKKKSITKSFKPYNTRIENETKIGLTDAKNNDVKLKVYLKAVKDLIVEDSKALRQYDWLSSTVQIQSALAKLKDILQRYKKSKPIHPSDVQILKYTVFLHNLSLEIRDATYFANQLRKKNLLPRNKKKRSKILKEKGLIDRVWLYLRSKLPGMNMKDGVTKLEEFVLNIENGLYDLHDALKNIALITKYNNQNWYNNLKDLYLTMENKHLNEILLHLFVSRLFELIEKSCESGLEQDFVKYTKNHRKEGKLTLDEIIFVVRILDEINKEPK